MAVRQSADHDNAALLLAELLADAWGQVSVSVYDTARLVSSVPWLSGHAARLDYLCHEQASDGTWGAPDGYAIVPTLSATESLLAELRRPSARQREQLTFATDRGLTALHQLLGTDLDGGRAPDTIAVELVVPAMVANVNGHLHTLATEPAAGLDDRWAGARLTCPPDLGPAPATALIGELERGRPLPEKLWASIETLGSAATEAPSIRPAWGAVAGSPAATAAWLGSMARHGHRGLAASESVRYLEQLQARCGGPVPAVMPITYFESAWVLNTLAAAGLPYEVPMPLLDRLEAALSATGAPAGPGIPVDADDTAGVLCALARHGRLHRPDALLHYRTDGYFTCFPDERTPSTSTNAHILEALGLYLHGRPAEGKRFGSAFHMVSNWLIDNQRADGSWQDKWHASPYYATVRCAAALAAHDGERSRHPLARAVDWILETQRQDGSWGRWQGTIEETSYAVQTIIRSRASSPEREDAVVQAAARGRAFLRTANDPARYPGLWHAKDLYAPTAVIRAARLAALHLSDELSTPDGASSLPAGSAEARPRLAVRPSPTATQADNG
jgi:halimadienyl-diphosphate synthase